MMNNMANPTPRNAKRREHEESNVNPTSRTGSRSDGTEGLDRPWASDFLGERNGPVGAS
jgi:hypothetical protein